MLSYICTWLIMYYQVRYACLKTLITSIINIYFIVEKKSDLQEPVAMVINETLPHFTRRRSLDELNDQFIEAHSDSLDHIIVGQFHANDANATPTLPIDAFMTMVIIFSLSCNYYYRSTSFISTPPRPTEKSPWN